MIVQEMGYGEQALGKVYLFPRLRLGMPVFRALSGYLRILSGGGARERGDVARAYSEGTLIIGDPFFRKDAGESREAREWPY